MVLVHAHKIEVAFAAQLAEALFQLFGIGVGEVGRLLERIEVNCCRAMSPFLDQLGVA